MRFGIIFTSSTSVLELSWRAQGFPETLLEAPGPSPDRSGCVPGACFRILGASWRHPGASPKRFGSPKTAQDRFVIDFCLFRIDFSLFFRRFGIRFRVEIVVCLVVLLFVRFLLCSLARSFIYAFVCAFVSAFVCSVAPSVARPVLRTIHLRCVHTIPT